MLELCVFLSQTNIRLYAYTNTVYSKLFRSFASISLSFRGKQRDTCREQHSIARHQISAHSDKTTRVICCAGRVATLCVYCIWWLLEPCVPNDHNFIQPNSSRQCLSLFCVRSVVVDAMIVQHTHMLEINFHLSNMMDCNGQFQCLESYFIFTFVRMHEHTTFFPLVECVVSRLGSLSLMR